MATQDEIAGMAWWNSLTDAARRFWLEQAGGARAAASAADAWRAVQARQKEQNLERQE